MGLELILVVSGVFFAVALLYTSVGHAGASGYLAVMAIAGLPFETMRPTALTLNILVASLTSWRFYQAGLLKWIDVLPFVICSVPLAFIGGWIALPSEIYRPVLGTLLLLAAAYLVWRSVSPANEFEKQETVVPKLPAMGTGGLIGFISGLTGIGGGVLLSPVVLITKWAGARSTSAIAAAFILLNSTAALAGNIAAVRSLPPELPFFVAAVLLGGFLGSELGIRRLPVKAIVGLLAVALVVAGGKFIVF